MEAEREERWWVREGGGRGWGVDEGEDGGRGWGVDEGEDGEG